jgi:hypothetical protein
MSKSAPGLHRGERLHRDRAPCIAIEGRAPLPPAAPASRVAPNDEYGVTPEKTGTSSDRPRNNCYRAAGFGGGQRRRPAQRKRRRTHRDLDRARGTRAVALPSKFSTHRTATSFPLRNTPIIPRVPGPPTAGEYRKRSNARWARRSRRASRTLASQGGARLGCRRSDLSCRRRR